MTGDIRQLGPPWLSTWMPVVRVPISHWGVWIGSLACLKLLSDNFYPSCNTCPASLILPSFWINWIYIFSFIRFSGIYFFKIITLVVSIN